MKITKDQISISDYLADVKEQKILAMHGGECWKCVMYHSHRCRNNWDRPCPEGLYFEEYAGSKVKQCIGATIEVFQDGYMHCPIVNTDGMGCEWCMKELRKDKSFFRYDASQNYERVPKWA